MALPLVLAGTLTASASASAPTTSIDKDAPARAGFSSTGVTTTMVATSFTVPQIDCTTTPDSGASIVVSFDHLHTSPYRIGISFDCTHGTPSYSAWWKAPGRSRDACSDTPQPGRVEDAEMYVQGRVVLSSSDCGEIFDNLSESGFLAASVQVRAEVGPAGRVLPLTDFGTVYCWQAEVNDAPMGSTDTVDWRMVGGSGDVLALASGLHDDGSFAINWRAAS